VGSHLYCDHGRFLCRLLVSNQGLRPAVTRSVTMDYVIAGIAALFLFVYLLYALLKPEKF
jgi:K+-transporting ATPase KdpF subunit